MTFSVTMPALGESVTEGTVTRWLKGVGDTVSADEPLLEVSTDKVDTEIPSPASGVILEIRVAQDETVDVGTELAIIGEPAEGGPAVAAPAPAAPASAAPAPAAPISAPAPVTQAVVAPAPSAPPIEAPVAVPAVSTSVDAALSAATPVLLPALGESVTEGTVTRWLKAVGDVVTADEPLLEVSTDKVDTEIPAPASGVLLAIEVAQDETVDVGTTLGLIGAVGAVASPVAAPAAPPAAAAPVAVAPVAPATPVPAPAAPAPATAAPAPAAAPPAAPVIASATSSEATDSSGTEDGYVTPLVRRLATEHSIDLATITGTGVGGRIRKQDVLDAVADRAAAVPASTQTATAATVSTPVSTPAATASPSPQQSQDSPLRGRTEPLSRLRKVIAARMVESLQVSAQLTSVVEVDVTRIATLRTRAKSSFEAREGVKLSFLPFFAKAAVEALRVYPVLNASIDVEAGTVTYHGGEHLGVAVDTERGLLVPVIRDAGDLTIAGLARKVGDIAERTRTNKVSPDELSGGTFTLTNTGSRGALFDTPIINQPQVAILGTGAVVKRPVVITDETGAESLAIRSMVYLSLSYDHRLVDGADAARFLVAVKTRLEAAAFEADLGL